MATGITVVPTRMELIRLRRRIALAQRGYELLKEKMDALVMEFFTVLKDIERVKSQTLEQLSKAFRELSLCQAEIGTIETLQTALALERGASVEMSTKYTMGVMVPKLEMLPQERPHYPIHTTSASLDAAVLEFRQALQEVVKLAEMEAAAYALASELERTKRRVNALEHVLIPRLQQMIKFIQSRLDEMERENFTRLKRIKAVREAREET